MEPSFSKYIWQHTKAQQIWILCIVLISMLPFYLALDLPRSIVNGPIQGIGFESPGATQLLMPISLTLPWFGDVTLLPGIPLERIPTLIGLSLAFLALVIINGLFKYYINIFKGLLGERLLRRIRYELVDRILRFLPGQFKHIKGGEIASMVKDEVEPLGGFTGDAFVQPALLGGQAITALAFIFVQNVWLGLVAFFMAAVQFAIIPRLRRRLIVLGRERQISARQLAGRVTEIVDGITTIHANDTSNFERADIAARLGHIFTIRYEIYRRKFMVKFINNSLAQLTPFLFYLIGGYLAIIGRIDVGQLIAVINAYKELPGPLKELIDWDLARQDVQVKYEQVVEHFNSNTMLPPALQAIDTGRGGKIWHPLDVLNLSLDDDAGARTLEHVSLRVNPGETIAIIGDAHSGADAIAEVLGRLAKPSAGAVTAGEIDLHALPHSITGRRISYAAADGYFFFGSLKDNLLYGLKHAPQKAEPYQGAALAQRKRTVKEAARSGNPDFDLDGPWINPHLVRGYTPETGMLGAMMAALDVVCLSDDVFEFALHSTFDTNAEPDLAASLLDLRQSFRAELETLGLSNLVVPFQAGAYNPEARIVDNLLFGVLSADRDAASISAGRDYFRSKLLETGLYAQLYYMGLSIAETTLDLFQDIPRDHPFFERLSYMKPEDMPRFRALLLRLKGLDFKSVSYEDRFAIIELSFHYVEPQHRLGLLDDTLRQRIIDVREQIFNEAPPHLHAAFERYDAARYLTSANLLDNIVFGKINQRLNEAARRTHDIITRLMQAKPGLYRRIIAVGLEYNLGAAGRRLTTIKRQKLNFARALIRRSEYYIFNRPLAGLDETLQDQIVTRSLAYLRADGGTPAVVWVLSNKVFTKHFQRRVVFSERTVIEDASTETAVEIPDNMMVKRVDT